MARIKRQQINPYIMLGDDFQTSYDGNDEFFHLIKEKVGILNVIESIHNPSKSSLINDPVKKIKQKKLTARTNKLNHHQIKNMKENPSFIEGLDNNLY